MPHTLQSLIRLRKWHVDEKRRILVNLQESETQVMALLHALEEQGQKEKQIATSDPTGAGRLYGDYARWAKERRLELQQTLEDIREHILTARDHLREAFKELKTSEIVEDTRTQNARDERDRRDIEIQNEVALDMYRRDTKKP